MLDPSAVIYFIALVLIASIVFLVRRTRLAFGAMAAVSTLTLAHWGWWIWFFRDGMGPDSIPSQGAEAMTRFLENFWIPAACWALLIVTGLLILRATKVQRETRSVTNE